MPNYRGGNNLTFFGKSFLTMSLGTLVAWQLSPSKGSCMNIRRGCSPVARALRAPISFFFEDPLNPKGDGRRARSPDYVSEFFAPPTTAWP
jgi:hypothetical protein